MQSKPWGQKKLAVVERWPLWAGMGVMSIGVREKFCWGG